MKKIKRWKLVEIVWFDSTHSAGWTLTSSIDWEDRVSALLHRSVGYVAFQDKNGIALVQSYQDRWENGMPQHVDAIITIPVRAIKSLTVIKGSEKTRVFPVQKQKTRV